MYTMTRILSSDLPKEQLHQQIAFDAGSTSELAELLQIFDSGREDDRITEPEIPAEWRKRVGFNVWYMPTVDAAGEPVAVEELAR